MSNASPTPPIIYNLFPSLVGAVDTWMPHVHRAAEMGFNWIFLNPIHLTGASGSLYAVRDYFQLSPVFFPSASATSQWAALKQFTRDAEAVGVRVMVDLVINHTAYDNPLTKSHRNWYKTDDHGNIRSPGAKDDSAPGGWVTWGDLSEIDNEHSADKENLHAYWWKLVEMFLQHGISGFRCDAAYHIPESLWRMLIDRARQKNPQAQFFAESLGCPIEDNLTLARAGHDYTFNSGKWWDFREGWFLEQLAITRGQTHSICFPESHDTPRLAEELNNDIDQIKQRYFFTALITAGVMIPLGFEYGFRKKLHVVETNPLWYEGAHCDLTDFIREINYLKRAHRVFQEDNIIEKIDSGNDRVLALRKTTLDGKEHALLLLNLHDQPETVQLGTLMQHCAFSEIKRDNQKAALPKIVKLRRWGAAALAV